MPRTPVSTAEGDTEVTPEDRPKDAPFYCPGCGRRYEYRQQCTGKPESPHPPIEVVSTDELKSGDPSQHSTPEYV